MAICAEQEVLINELAESDWQRGGEGEALRIGLNPDYLGQFLAALETEKVLFELKDENSQCLGSPIGGEDDRYLCVIMPMRI